MEKSRYSVTKSNLHSIFPQKIMNCKHQNGGKLHTTKSKKLIFFSKPKEESHTNIIPILITKMKGIIYKSNLICCYCYMVDSNCHSKLNSIFFSSVLFAKPGKAHTGTYLDSFILQYILGCKPIPGYCYAQQCNRVTV